MPTRLYLASTSPARRSLLAQSGIEPVLVAPGVDEDAVATAESERLGRALTGPELVALLAVAKARAVAGSDDAPGSVAGERIDGVVFGGDSAFEVDGVLYGKPHDPGVARDRWRGMLAAGGGTLWSGHCIIDRRADGDRVPDGRDGSAPHPGLAGSPGAFRESLARFRRAERASPSVVTTGITRPAPETVVAVDSAVLTFAADMSADEIDAYVATGEPLEVAGAFTIDGRAAAYIARIDGSPSAVVGLSLPMLRAMLLEGFGIPWHDLWNGPGTL
ncbi:Maf family protein [Curtobacterium sp. Leaf261]|uniref:Maf family protein n=1 Tax=Curtobacterium sp. Leaf261 TaxID=1736311 RepID=UPI0006F85DF7|nr:Maf family protein [Curtobacterium sp. Leaf261]KQO62192.1 septum formation inhibitor Maf [Curtobacterium sp. Leaf261]